MAKNDVKAKNDVEAKNQAESDRFTRKQLVCSEKYCNHSDLLCALLEDGKQYTLSEADEIMNRFMKGKVKVC
ncbi:hypothetical protein [Lacrimispora sp. JR3]|uniref:hypothetical protein n=1 Tax=Lacrimispora sinapis TaxID=3111456 RepID=UPI00374993E8